MKIVALAGGVGGAKLADGFAQSPGLVDDLTVIVNTGDDFTLFGLRICPDLDTVCYTLAGLANPITGWGRAGETWGVYDAVRGLGGPGWFRLGDTDLGTHLERTRRLLEGEKLSRITQDFCRVWGVAGKIIPMTNDTVSTWVDTHEMGWLPFQEYFVLHGWKPRVKKIEFRGIDNANPVDGVLELIASADCIILCPSNPFVSIAPILAVPGLGEAIRLHPHVIAVSPLVGGEALKGPAAKMFLEMEIVPSAYSVAEFYRSVIKGMIIDSKDGSERGRIMSLGIKVAAENTIMVDKITRKHLAERVVKFAKEAFFL
jgi:LPPG:FO 2-phospho-L-lactate transferase